MALIRSSLLSILYCELQSTRISLPPILEVKESQAGPTVGKNALFYH